MGGYEKEEGSPLPVSVKFTSIKEAENFYKSYSTHFMSWICDISHQQQHLQETLLPYLGDYTHPWTDQMLYDYFGLTDDEIKTIEKEIQ